MSDAPIPINDDNEPIKIDDDEPIKLEETSLVGDAEEAASRVKVAETLGKQLRDVTEFRRPLNVTGQGATRCRMFHSKLSAASLGSMQDQINEWIDRDEIEVKHVGHNIGILQGKINEENIFVMVWY